MTNFDQVFVLSELHEHQKHLVKRVNEAITKMKDAINEELKQSQNEVKLIRECLDLKQKINDIMEHLTTASDWSLLQTMYEREDEINNIINFMNTDMKSTKTLSVPCYEKRKISKKKEDQFLKEVCKSKSVEKIPTRLNHLGTLKVLPTQKGETIYTVTCQ